MKICIASDHAGYDLKESIKKALVGKGIQIEDYGTHDPAPMDYVDTGILAAEDVSRGDSDFGVLICGTGHGMCMIANKVKGVRASVCHTIESAKLTRQHNNANVLVLPGKFIEPKYAIDLLLTFIYEPFSTDERHLTRINKIKKYENKEV